MQRGQAAFQESATEMAAASGRGRWADGGEVIFSLPNRLHAFLLLDRHGRRLDKAPLAIVSDARRPDRAVENGISCMSCHAGGLIPKADQVRAHVEKNGGAFTPEEVAAVKALYPPEDKQSVTFARDNARYRQALESVGVSPAATEPIVALALRCEQEFDLSAAAAEVGLRPAELSVRLDSSPTLMRTLGVLRVSGGTVQRAIFNDSFPTLVRELGTGRFLSPGTADGSR